MYQITNTECQLIDDTIIAALDAACEALHQHQMLAVSNLAPVVAVETILQLQQAIIPMHRRINRIHADNNARTT